MKAPCSTTKMIARVEDVPRANIFPVVFSIFLVGIFSSFSVFSLVSGAFTLTFRRVQRFVYLATRGRPQQSYGLRIVYSTTVSHNSLEMSSEPRG